MSDKEQYIQIPVELAKELYQLLSDVNQLLHQPLNYRNPEYVEKFCDKFHGQVSELYYKRFWELLPEEIQREITDEDND